MHVCTYLRDKMQFFLNEKITILIYDITDWMSTDRHHNKKRVD